MVWDGCCTLDHASVRSALSGKVVCKADNAIKHFESVDHGETWSSRFIPFFPQWWSTQRNVSAFPSGSAKRRGIRYHLVFTRPQPQRLILTALVKV